MKYVKKYIHNFKNISGIKADKLPDLFSSNFSKMSHKPFAGLMEVIITVNVSLLIIAILFIVSFPYISLQWYRFIYPQLVCIRIYRSEWFIL